MTGLLRTGVSRAAKPARSAAVRNARGFTLLEVLVALSLLGIAVSIVFQLFSANMKAVRASEDYVSATVRAHARMREILEDAKLGEKNWTETTMDGYRVDVTVQEILKERTKDLQVQLLAVALTIYWVKDSKVKTFTMKAMKMIPKKVT